MTPHIAMPTMPPRAAADSDPGSRSSAADGQFDATLRQSRHDRGTHGASHASGPAGHPHGASHVSGPAGHTHGASHAAGRDGHTPGMPSADPHDPDHAHHQHDQDDRGPIASPVTVPGTAPTVSGAAGMPARQAAAAAGKGVPANAPPTTVASVALARPGGASGTVGTPRASAEFSSADARRQGAMNPRAAQPPANPTSTAPNIKTPEPKLLSAVLSQASLRDAAGDKDSASTGLNAQAGHPVGLWVGQVAAQGGSAPGGQMPAQLTMQASPGQPQFVPETTQHVAWLVGNHIQQAEIQLNPRSLGPIRIDISTRHDHVDVSFAAQNPQTVQALQQTLPQLAEMLAQQGLNLGQASVGQQAPGQQHAPPAAYPGSRWRHADVDIPVQASRLRRVQLGRVDEFA